MTANPVVHPDLAALARDAARRIAAAAAQHGDGAPPFHLALSGGNTPKAVFDEMARGAFPRDLVPRTHLWWGDERAVPASHADSNVRMARERLADPLGFPKANVHAPDGGAADLAAEAQRCEDEILETVPCNRDGEPVLDLVMLGMGADGHTASLFPGTKALDVRGRVFVENDVPQLKTRRLTLTFEAILAARAVLILVAGADKAAPLGEVLRGGSPHPIERISRNHPNVTWLVDAAAAGKAPTP